MGVWFNVCSTAPSKNCLIMSGAKAKLKSTQAVTETGHLEAEETSQERMEASWHVLARDL